VAGFLALGPCICVNAQPGSPMRRMPRISPPTPVYTPPPVRPYAPPSFPRYGGPPIQQTSVKSGFWSRGNRNLKSRFFAQF
jgi:hypothetical protein